jgi:diguanylate cyclase (GGDEF)-like protein
MSSSIAPIRSQADVVRWTIVQTLLALLLVFPVSVLTTLCVFGGDLDRSIAASAAMRVCFLSSFVEVFAFAPVLAIRSAHALLKLSQSQDALERLAYVDPLTGLLNRRGFDRAAEEALSLAAAKQAPVAALMCDLDRFKAINDRHGHDFGDAALRHVAAILQSKAKDRPIVVGRQGGEEFAALATGMTWFEAVVFTEDLRRAIADASVAWNGCEARLTMSFGLSTGFAHASTVAQLVAEADAALLEAKRQGRDRVEAARSGLQEMA